MSYSDPRMIDGEAARYADARVFAGRFIYQSITKEEIQSVAEASMNQSATHQPSNQPANRYAAWLRFYDRKRRELEDR